MAEFPDVVSKFSIGDPVWAKMKGFFPWPGKVVSPTKDVKRPALKKSMHCVYFFGTKNYAWVLEEHIKPYLEFKEMHTQKSKSSSFKEAVETADDYVKSLPEKAVRTSELPSIEEEIATIFPDGTKKAEKPHRDYSRTPFLGRTKVCLTLLAHYVCLNIELTIFAIICSKK
ncbi:putative oxidoreductase GLYR1 homolog isoform X1 [Limulus polyphemus]|uniref:Oxidoreductase GLYR1 homolog isoform X1 n=1 Tax=Limulus polyphemus TaxID=6850 RepID=A0ABM1C183_LIMPO|nr:putative oxidoreductase GLYR1 homolog isoform X1 [Limulus polyphemus]